MSGPALLTGYLLRADDVAYKYGGEIWYLIQVIECIKAVTETECKSSARDIYLNRIVSEARLTGDTSKVNKALSRERSLRRVDLIKLRLPLVDCLNAYKESNTGTTNHYMCDILTGIRNNLAHSSEELYSLDIDKVDGWLEKQLDIAYDLLVKITTIDKDDLIYPDSVR